MNTRIHQISCGLHEERKPDLGPSGEWCIVKSEPRGAYVIVKPGITPANYKIACAVAGSAGGEVQCLPLSPSITTKATSIDDQMTCSNHMSTVYPQSETCGESQGGSRDDHTQETLTTQGSVCYTSQCLASQDGVQDTKSAHASEVEDAGHDHATEPS
jgi:hypothetical protein